jgi:hypothetical protein
LAPSIEPEVDCAWRATEMRLRSVARRLAVTLPFFAVSAVVLGFFSNPTVPGSADLDDPSSLVLIVTTESLHPAFRALEIWSQAHGCPSDVVALGSGFEARAGVFYLASLCRERRATSLLLGGDSHILPMMSGAAGERVAPGSTGGPRILLVPTPRKGVIPEGVAVGRAPVKDLAEAWDFVNAVRTSGLNLDQLIVATSDVAARLREETRPAGGGSSVTVPLYSAAAPPVR